MTVRRSSFQWLLWSKRRRSFCGLVPLFPAGKESGCPKMVAKRRVNRRSDDGLILGS
jgi:hypothetical protein